MQLVMVAAPLLLLALGCSVPSLCASLASTAHRASAWPSIAKVSPACSPRRQWWPIPGPEVPLDGCDRFEVQVGPSAPPMNFTLLVNGSFTEHQHQILLRAQQSSGPPGAVFRGRGSIRATNLTLGLWTLVVGNINASPTSRWWLTGATLVISEDRAGSEHRILNRPNCEPDLYEPNDDPAHATHIKAKEGKQALIGSWCPTGDVDHFVIDVVSPTWIEAKIANNSRANLLLRDLDDISTWAAVSGGPDRQLSVLLVSGTFILLTSGPIGPYLMTLSLYVQPLSGEVPSVSTKTVHAKLATKTRLEERLVKRSGSEESLTGDTSSSTVMSTSTSNSGISSVSTSVSETISAASATSGGASAFAATSGGAVVSTTGGEAASFATTSGSEGVSTSGGAGTAFSSSAAASTNGGEASSFATTSGNEDASTSGGAATSFATASNSANSATTGGGSTFLSLAAASLASAGSSTTANLGPTHTIDTSVGGTTSATGASSSDISAGTTGPATSAGDSSSFIESTLSLTSGTILEATSSTSSPSSGSLTATSSTSDVTDGISLISATASIGVAEGLFSTVSTDESTSTSASSSAGSSTSSASFSSSSISSSSSTTGTSSSITDHGAGGPFALSAQTSNSPVIVFLPPGGISSSGSTSSTTTQPFEPQATSSISSQGSSSSASTGTPNPNEQPLQSSDDTRVTLTLGGDATGSQVQQSIASILTQLLGQPVSPDTIYGITINSKKRKRASKRSTSTTVSFAVASLKNFPSDTISSLLGTYIANNPIPGLPPVTSIQVSTLPPTIAPDTGMSNEESLAIGFVVAVISFVILTGIILFVLLYVKKRYPNSRTATLFRRTSSGLTNSNSESANSNS